MYRSAVTFLSLKRASCLHATILVWSGPTVPSVDEVRQVDGRGSTLERKHGRRHVVDGAEGWTRAVSVTSVCTNVSFPSRKCVTGALPEWSQGRGVLVRAGDLTNSLVRHDCYESSPVPNLSVSCTDQRPCHVRFPTLQVAWRSLSHASKRSEAPVTRIYVVSKRRNVRLPISLSSLSSNV